MSKVTPKVYLMSDLVLWTLHRVHRRRHEPAGISATLLPILAVYMQQQLRYMLALVDQAEATGACLSPQRKSWHLLVFNVLADGFILARSG
jgi:hypothetical protein